MTGFLKIILRCLLRVLYRVEVTGMEHYHQAGKRVLIVANHISLLDGILLYAWLPDTPRFAINTQVATRAQFKPFLYFADLYTMDPTNPLSVKSMVRYLQNDRKAVIFPEGRITTSGSLMKIYEGPGLIADRSGATLLPIAIDGPQLTSFGLPGATQKISQNQAEGAGAGENNNRRLNPRTGTAQGRGRADAGPDVQVVFYLL